MGDSEHAPTGHSPAVHAVRFKGKVLFISEVLVGERVGVEEVDDGIGSLSFDRVLLGRLDVHTWTLHLEHL